MVLFVFTFDALYSAMLVSSDDQERVTLRLAVYRQFSPLRLTASNFFFQLNTCSYSPYVTVSLARRWVCRLQLLLVLASGAILKSESRRSHDHILLSQIRDYANLEDHVPVFMSPRNRVAQLYPQEPGSVFVASYDSQGYGGGIRPHLRTDSDKWISDDPEIPSLN
jgi:hypothetical protein